MTILTIPNDEEQEKKLGEFAFKRLQILAALKEGRTVESLKEQLREIEKKMVHYGWDGKAHIVRYTSDGLRVIRHKTPPKGTIIRVKPFNMKVRINK